MMHAQQYFRDFNQHLAPDYLNDIERNQIYLRVNCAGYCDLPPSFCRIQPGGRNDYYMMYLLEGTLLVTTGNTAENFVLSPGHLFIFPPHTFFRYEPIGTTHIQYLWVHFTGYGAENLLSDCFLPLLSPCNIGFPKEVEEKYEALFQVFLHRDLLMDTVAISRLMDICVLFGQSLLIQSENTSASISKHVHRLHASLAYIHKNLSQPLSIPLLAEMEHLGVSRYRTLFHEIFGVSPLVYIRKLRIQQAMNFLQQTNLPITQIASSVGFEDSLYFSRVFRKMIGVSPTEYRNYLSLENME